MREKERLRDPTKQNKKQKTKLSVSLSLIVCVCVCSNLGLINYRAEEVTQRMGQAGRYLETRRAVLPDSVRTMTMVALMSQLDLTLEEAIVSGTVMGGVITNSRILR